MIFIQCAFEARSCIIGSRLSCGQCAGKRKVAPSHPPQNFSRKSGPACRQRIYNNFEVLGHFGTFQPLVTPEPEEVGS